MTWFWHRSVTSRLTPSACIIVAAVRRRSCGVYSPFSPLDSTQRVVVSAVLERLAVLKAHLSVADLLGNGLDVDVTLFLASGEAPPAFAFTFAGEPMQFLEVTQCEVRQVDLPVHARLAFSRGTTQVPASRSRCSHRAVAAVGVSA